MNGKLLKGLIDNNLSYLASTQCFYLKFYKNQVRKTFRTISIPLLMWKRHPLLVKAPFHPCSCCSFFLVSFDVQCRALGSPFCASHIFTCEENKPVFRIHCNSVEIWSTRVLCKVNKRLRLISKCQQSLQWGFMMCQNTVAFVFALSRCSNNKARTLWIH